ncbi:MAG TPA: FHA domain-containing protein [Anaerolineales bacterium]|nr:FHA domain-containing protein [Anaerolineales bacterium]
MMDISYGKLILLNPNGPEQEFKLAKASISLGRANTNDIILDDVRVSRSHAQLESSTRGLTLIDLGSSNGTRLNGLRIDRATLRPGDTISLGSQQLKYQVEDPSEDLGLTKIDSQMQLEQTMNQEYLPRVINETSTPSLVVFTGEKTWRVDLNNLDLAVIGRDESCAVYIESSKVSRRHAEVQQVSGAFVLKDLGSTNGTWLGEQQVEHHILQDGDTFRVGPAQIVFKRGFQEQALTMADEFLEVPTGRRTVVFVPGTMGSELWLGNERVWPSVRTIFTNPEIFIYPSRVPLEPRNIVDEVVIVPNLIKQDQYNRLGDYLVEELNYQRGVDFFEFPYDWRQDVRTSARQLAQLVEGLPAERPIIIIAHSLGTMVSRYYIERLGGHKRIERAILMGGPHKGAVKGLVSMLVAPEVLPFGIMGERLRQIILTFPSSYQILPDYAVGKDQHGVQINFIKDKGWLDDKYLPLLKMGRDFRNELGATASIPSVSIFGYGLKTIADVSVVRDARGKLQNVNYLSGNIGDGSVLEQSAFLAGTDIHPVHQHHGALFIDNDVKMRLKLELTRPY